MEAIGSSGSSVLSSRDTLRCAFCGLTGPFICAKIKEEVSMLFFTIGFREVF